MTLVKTNGNKPVAGTFSDLFEDLFSKPIGKWLDEDVKPPFYKTFPPVNIKETKDSYILDIVSPGLEKEDFKMKTEGKTLFISAEKKAEKKDENDKFIRNEYSYRSFTRSFTLNDDIDREKINAKYDKGVLKVTLPKKEEKIEKHTEITVQ